RIAEAANQALAEAAQRGAEARANPNDPARWAEAVAAAQRAVDHLSQEDADPRLRERARGIAQSLVRERDRAQRTRGEAEKALQRWRGSPTIRAGPRKGTHPTPPHPENNNNFPDPLGPPPA